eukprot:746828-Hanusia_phi.AAC.4
MPKYCQGCMSSHRSGSKDELLVARTHQVPEASAAGWVYLVGTLPPALTPSRQHAPIMAEEDERRAKSASAWPEKSEREQEDTSVVCSTKNSVCPGGQCTTAVAEEPGSNVGIRLVLSWI